MSPWTIRVFEQHRMVFSDEVAGPVELGRQSDGEEVPYTTRPSSGRHRAVIARLDEDSVSRQHALIEPCGDDRARVTNLSKKLAVRLTDGTDLQPGASAEIMLPALLTLGKKTVRLQPAASEDGNLQSLAEATVPPGAHARPAGGLPTLLTPPAGAPAEAENIVRWLQAALGVLHSAASSADFFSQAARAIVELAGLDSGRVLLLEGDAWKVESLAAAPGVSPEGSWTPSKQVLGRVRQQKRTFWQSPQAAGYSGSLVGVKAVVAAPILDRNAELIGALYGERRRAGLTAPISRMEAMLVELLAGGVAAGLSRLEQERAALAARTRFEQFFTTELSQHLAEQPDMLKDRDCVVTCLFCDIRGFSRISEVLGPGRTLEWLRDVLGGLSDCVLDHQGVLVDYAGDEVMAMWGAPAEQPDHARLACRAAVAMVDRLAELNAHWQDLLRGPMSFGIGINTGPARVGNVGSHRKFKYGLHGTTANLASRVQGATKYLRAGILVTAATRAELGEEFALRRLCRTGVVNIEQPVELYELRPKPGPGWSALRDSYEKALTAFEQGDFRQAAALLGSLLVEHADDGPSLVLLSRAVQAVVEAGSQSGPVWVLPGK